MRPVTKEEEVAAYRQVDKGVTTGNPRRDAFPRKGALPRQIRRALAASDGGPTPAEAAGVLRRTGVWGAFVESQGRTHNGLPVGQGWTGLGKSTAKLLKKEDPL